jgi:hypothetical protein
MLGRLPPKPQTIRFLITSFTALVLTGVSVGYAGKVGHTPGAEPTLTSSSASSSASSLPLSRPPPIPPRPRRPVISGECLNSSAASAPPSSLHTACALNHQANEIVSEMARATSPLNAIRNAFAGPGVHNGPITSPLTVQFQGRTFPLHFEVHGNTLEFAVKGSVHSDCLKFNADLEKKEGEIEGLYAGNNCPLPRENQGSVLLDFADALSRTLLLKKTNLLDVASVPCGDTVKSTSLTFLRNMQKGQGWYESKGFVPNDYADYRARYDRVRNYELSEIEHHPLGGKAIEGLLPKYRATRPASDTLAPFLSWLWKEDCNQYLEVRKSLFPPGESYLFPWSQDMPKNAFELTKTYRTECD